MSHSVKIPFCIDKGKNYLATHIQHKFDSNLPVTSTGVCLLNELEIKKEIVRVKRKQAKRRVTC